MKTNHERAIGVIAKHLGIEPGTIKPEASIADDLECDSLDVVELAMFMEDEFGIEIPYEDIEPLKTVGQMVDYLDKRLAVPTAG